MTQAANALAVHPPDRSSQRPRFPPTGAVTLWGMSWHDRDAMTQAANALAVHPPDRSSQRPRFPPTGAVTLWGMSWHDRDAMTQAANALFNATNLACRRGGRLVFSGLHFALPPGRALILRGPNGSGKSSLLRLLAGLGRPESGRIAW